MSEDKQPLTPDPSSPPSDSSPPHAESPKSSNRKKQSVFIYLAILFAAAFLLLLLAYFMQQRTSEAALGSLRDTVTTFESLDELLDENQSLRQQLAQAEESLSQAETKQDQLEQENQGLTDARDEISNQLDHVLLLERLEYLCEAGQTEEAQTLLNESGNLSAIYAALDKNLTSSDGDSVLPTFSARYQAVLDTLGVREEE